MDNRYSRVYVHMIGLDIKLIEVFKIFLKNTTEHNSNYLFEWLQQKLADPAIDKTELIDEMTKWMDRLVN